MHYVNLGKAGVKVSRICLGMMSYGDKAWREWTLSEDDGRPIVRRAAELGVNFYDTADVYSNGASEEVTGRLLKEVFRSRDEYVVATKVFNPMGEKPNQRGLSRKHILEGIDASLRRLRLDYLDLYIIHRWDGAVQAEETLQALHDVVRAGKALYIGASSMPAWQFAKALFLQAQHDWSRFVSMQNHYNLIYREEEREMIPLCVDQGIGITPWSPLARGFVMGNRTRDKKGETARSRSDGFAYQLYYQESDFAIADRVGEVAARTGLSRAKVALCWMLGKPYITSPIIGATKLQHLEDAVAAVEVKLTAEDVNTLEELYQPKAVAGI
jgi:aryl-alcohol dehydrogenase-like predicted oxidoreductase